MTSVPFENHMRASSPGHRHAPALQAVTKSTLNPRKAADGRSIPGHPTESWPDYFSDHDGGLVKDLGNGRKVYKINYDNSYHLVYRQRPRGDAARDVISQKYIIGMRLLMLGLEHALNGALSNGAKGTPLEECEDQFRLLSAKGAATTVLAVADHLPTLMEPLSMLPEPE